ncbi:MAG: SDR family NAD(P)-dependent oxidoreductase [Clostridia bacterium]|nr:SDR family NAD(P)-dependent oxidoreductase [Clostridia bacterium]
MKQIAVITGASSGMGRRCVETCGQMGPFDEVWVIARREDKLEALRESAPYPLRVLPLDLTDRGSYDVYAAALGEEPVEVKLLVNAAGFGKFRSVMDTPLEVNLNMVDLNCQAIQAMCQLTVPHMGAGSHILNFASVAAYQPIPYIDVYGASKAFVLSYSRALNRELKSRGVTVTAVCPFWTKTAFFDRAIDPDREPVVKKYDVMYDPKDVVAQAWRDVKRGKDMSRYGGVARFNGILAKLLPHSFVMGYWMRQQRLD